MGNEERRRNCRLDGRSGFENAREGRVFTGRRCSQWDILRNTSRAPQEGKLRVEFPDFLQPSDLFAIDVDAAAARLGAISVATYLEKREDAVTLDVKFDTLADGTSYTATTTLDAKAKNIRVVITNSGQRPLAR